MSSISYRLARVPVLGRIGLVAYRVRSLIRFQLRSMRQMVRWLYQSRELSNYTYELTETNKKYLASLLAHALGTTYQQVIEFIREAEQDQALADHIDRETAHSQYAMIADRVPKFGRRLGWYAVVRILKPRVVVETGVDKGLGACLIAAALRRNAGEGYAGRYFGTDIDPRAGYLFSGDYARLGQILYGDSLKSIESLQDQIDLFINDSDHSADYEAAEYEIAQAKLSSVGVIIGDNAHCTDKLHEFSLRQGRDFLYFNEQPVDHWYPGAGMAISLPPSLSPNATVAPVRAPGV
jgi:predicted O-methyltransferase YrrM